MLAKPGKVEMIHKYVSEMWFFFLATDGILLCIFFLKIYYGVRLAYKMIFPGNPTEEALMDDKEGQAKFNIRVLSK